MRLHLIVALDEGRAIGRGNDLPWRLPADLQRFKRLTTGQTVLMGRKTAQSIGRALPQRHNLVLTRQATVPYDGQTRVGSLDEAIELARHQGELWVLGGAEVYALALPQATDLHLTLVATRTPDADTWFPTWNPQDWEEVAREAHTVDAKHAVPFEFIDYRRRS